MDKRVKAASVEQRTCEDGMDGNECTTPFSPFSAPFGGFESPLSHLLPGKVCLALQGLQATAGDVSWVR